MLFHKPGELLRPGAGGDHAFGTDKQIVTTSACGLLRVLSFAHGKVVRQRDGPRLSVHHLAAVRV